MRPVLGYLIDLLHGFFHNSPSIPTPDPGLPQTPQILSRLVWDSENGSRSFPGLRPRRCRILTRKFGPGVGAAPCEKSLTIPA